MSEYTKTNKKSRIKIKKVKQKKKGRGPVMSEYTKTNKKLDNVPLCETQMEKLTPKNIHS